MQYKLLSLAALVATASAQMMNLTAALASNPNLTNLTAFSSYFPSSLAMAKNITVLAPSDQAFANFLKSPAGSAIAANDTAAIQAVLTYHILNGTYQASMFSSTPVFVPSMLSNPAYTNVTGGQRVEAVMVGQNVSVFSGLLQNSTVTQANINFTGGVLHVIDTVLTVPLNISATAEAAGLSAAAGALISTNLVNALDSAMDITAFVPNNAAFQAIGSAVGSLTIEQLSSILEYHVVNGTVAYSTSLSNNTMIKTMQGNNVTITITNGTVYVNSAKVVIPDVLVANGVVHVIDAVLNPNATTLTPNPSSTTVAFAGATSATDVPFTSGIPAPTSMLGGGAAVATSTAAAASSSSSAGAWAPMRTGAIGAAALFAAGGALINA
ncbi:hypothetical protein MMC30_004188 [Trapelia coarctata]|nr:hypothetical protein [Trapelia coarctata]